MTVRSEVDVALRRIRRGGEHEAERPVPRHTQRVYVALLAIGEMVQDDDPVLEWFVPHIGHAFEDRPRLLCGDTARRTGRHQGGHGRSPKTTA